MSKPNDVATDAPAEAPDVAADETENAAADETRPRTLVLDRWVGVPGYNMLHIEHGGETLTIKLVAARGGGVQAVCRAARSFDIRRGEIVDGQPLGAGRRVIAAQIAQARAEQRGDCGD